MIDEKKESESAEGVESESKAELTIDVITDLQAEVNRLKAAGLAYEKLLDKYRLGYFIPKAVEAVDIRPINTRSLWNFQDLLKQPDGGESAQLVLRCMADLMAECMELMEVSKIKKIRVDRDVVKQKEVDAIRKATSPEAKREKIKFTDMEKRINSIRKRAGTAAGMKELIPLVMAFLPGTSEVDAQAALESIFAKEARGTNKK